jgi:beta-1,4-mannosyltransferase
VLALRVGPGHVLVRLTERFEHWLAGRAQAQFCVSEALRDRLLPRAGAGACLVLHDRPLHQVAPVSDRERARILGRALVALDVAHDVAGRPTPVVMISPTSWSQDEDMTMVLEAMAALLRPGAGQTGSGLPPVVLFATGLGPGRLDFEARARRLAIPGLRIATGWLSDELYRELMRAAHLGLSLHRSASGLDLPMKIVDMIEAGLPVLAYDYAPCLGELLPRAHAAGLFTTSAELAARLRALLSDYPELAHLSRIRDAMRDLSVPSWAEEWRRVALPVLAGREPDSTSAPP